VPAKYNQFLFGLGLGLIIASLLILPTLFKSSQPAKTEIERMARELGMVYREEVLVFPGEEKAQPEEKNGPGQQAMESEKEVPTKPEAQTIAVEIVPGTSPEEMARLLKEKRVISDAGAFLARVYELKLEKKLRAGTYNFQVDTPAEEVIRTLAHQ
jgi:hypothetical protein